MKQNNFIITNENACYYECGYSCDNLIFLSLGSETFFITDARYELEARENAKVDKIIVTNDLIGECKKILKNLNIKNIHFDPYEFNFYLYSCINQKLSINFIKDANFSKEKRIIKSDKEIKLISNAMQIGRDGFKQFKKYVFDHGLVKTEKFLNFKAKELMSKTGEYSLSFDPIIAIEENASKPHALPTFKKFKKNKLLLMDAGVKYKRYCSDRTRTYINKKNKLQQKVYDTVLKAQEKAIKKATIGIKASKIDSYAREVIEKAGFGKYFIHSTGHGIGIDIHEYPNISSKSEVIIENNMVFTIEPGIYLPNKFGIRIEDTVAMINGKAIIL